MKKMILIMVLVGLIVMPVTGFAQFSDGVRQALQQAADASGESMKGARLPKDQTIALLPIGNDNDSYVSGLLMNVVTAEGFTCVEAGQSPFWDEIMKEVEWDARKSDILDPATLVTFGKLKGSQLILYGKIREASQDMRRVYVELELHLSSLVTKEHIWGGTFAKRYYVPGKVEGIVDLDSAVRDLIGEALAGAATSIKASSKLANVKSVALIPLAGDIDSYVQKRVQDVLSKTDLLPREIDIPTLAEAANILRDQPQGVDALIYGAVRDLSRELKEETPLSKTYEIHAEIQLSIRDAKNGDLLWSDTLSAVGMDEEETSAQTVGWRWAKNNPRMLLYILGGIVLFMMVLIFLRKMRRVR